MSENDLFELEGRRFLWALAAVTLVAALLRIQGLAAAPPTSDDFGVVTSAFEFVRRGFYGPTMWQHPKLRDLLTYLSLDWFGPTVAGLKGASLLLGTLSVPVLGLLGRRLFASGGIGLLAAFFLAVDPVHIDFSRQAIQEVQVPFFSLLGLLVALYYRPGRPLPLLICGVLFGLGLAGKWYVIFPMAVTLASLAWRVRCQPDWSRRDKWGETALLLAALTLLPATVYLLTYLPWFVQGGHDLSDWVTVQLIMVRENLVHQGFNTYLMENSSRPALWFLKPVAWADFVLAGPTPTVWIAVSNPFVWLLTLPAVGLMTYRGIKERREGLLFLAAIFWASYLPLALAKRPIWVNTSFAVTPFAFLAVAYAVVAVTRQRRHGLRLVGAYLALVLLAAVPLYLLATGAGFDNALLHPLVEGFRPANER